jgi:excisionase family DNA binding protein
MDPGPFLTPRDVALAMGVTVQRVYQWIQAGQIPATDVAGRLRVPRAAWEAWLRCCADEALASTRGRRSADGDRPHGR